MLPSAPYPDLLKEVLKHEVYPALGCTEPAACAYCAALAAQHLGEPPRRLVLRVDPGTFKNGAAVTVPNSGGRKGNLAAAALGAALARPEGRLELLRNVTPETCAAAQALLESGRCRIECLEGERDMRIEVRADGEAHQVVCTLSGSHTRIEEILRDGRPVALPADASPPETGLRYREFLREASLVDLIAAAQRMDAADRRHVAAGLQMNAALAAKGQALKGTGYQLEVMLRRGYLSSDLFYQAKASVAAAVDARMTGVDLPAMTSGGSGNQGIVASLTLAIVGRGLGVPEERVLESIAAAHLINAYVKCFVGELSVNCGCALAAGIAVAAAIVFQKAGADAEKMTLAVNSVIGDLGGLICDGAKPGCALKSITAVDAAVRAGLMAVEGYGPSVEEGVLGRSAEESIRNLSRLTLEGMFQVDPVVIGILRDKAGRSGRA